MHKHFHRVCFTFHPDPSHQHTQIQYDTVPGTLYLEQVRSASYRTSTQLLQSSYIATVGATWEYHLLVLYMMYGSLRRSIRNWWIPSVALTPPFADIIMNSYILHGVCM